MYAVIRDGSDQYRVEKGHVLWFDLKSDKKPGDKVEFPVLLLADGDKIEIGKPEIADAKVVGEVVGHVKDDKVRVFKYRRREGYHRTRGHRQQYTEVRIVEITR